MFPGTYPEWEQKNRPEPPPEPRRPRPAPRRQPAAAKPKPRVKAAGTDMAQVIDDLEIRLSRIETDLENASAGQDMDAIIRLGEEHETVREELEKAWLEFAR